MTNKFDWDDILIEPAVETSITSRGLVKTNYDKPSKHLPLIAAPMDTVVSGNNIQDFLDNEISVCLPRGYRGKYPNESRVWISVSLQEFKEIISWQDTSNIHPYILIDIANGHIKDLCDTVKKARNKFDGYFNQYLHIMVGNVATPEAFANLANAGADYIRCGIGNGNGCLTTEQTGIGYPMASLISECLKIRNVIKKPTKIVADGGMKKYADIIKALALGADYVMVGSLFNKCLESSGQNYFHGIPVSKKVAEFLFKRGFTVNKKFRGMSTKEVQKAWGKTDIKTSEGIVKIQKVEYTLSSWTKNFKDYLASAMSYTNKLNLPEFIGNVNYNHITNAAFKRYNK